MKPSVVRGLVAAALMAALAALTTGCAATAVKPWDRDLLAQPRMQFAPSKLRYAIDQHIYFSKEGSTGGMELAGGGCGCN
jgi:uncharacterized protein DUF4266